MLVCSLPNGAALLTIYFIIPCTLRELQRHHLRVEHWWRALQGVSISVRWLAFWMAIAVRRLACLLQRGATCGVYSVFAFGVSYDAWDEALQGRTLVFALQGEILV